MEESRSGTGSGAGSGAVFFSQVGAGVGFGAVQKLTRLHNPDSGTIILYHSLKYQAILFKEPKPAKSQIAKTRRMFENICLRVRMVGHK